MSWRALRAGACGLLLAGAGWQLGAAGYVHLKAALAQLLLRDAWAQTLDGARAVKPWPWADTWPVARLRVPRHAQDLIVLAGASGRTLAFAPGHLHGSAHLGQPGRTVIAGHRDTHFGFLRAVRPGDELQLQDETGSVRRFEVTATRVVDSTSATLALDGDRELVLVTCYPFDAIRAGGPLRYVVFASPYRAAGAHISPQFDHSQHVFDPAAHAYPGA